MKRKVVNRSGIREPEVLRAFTKKQLQWIGAVVMAYNDTERLLHYLTAACFTYPASDREITTRINGTEGLVFIIRAATKALDLDEAVIECFDRALAGEGFSQLKRYRDAVIHANLLDQKSKIGLLYGSKAKLEEVLLSEAALKRLYDALALVGEELDALQTIIECTVTLDGDTEPDDQRKAQLEESIRDATAQCRRYQHLRRSLGPFPKFPDRDELLIRL